MKCRLWSVLFVSLLWLSGCDEWQLTRTATPDTITDLPDEEGRATSDTAGVDVYAVEERPRAYDEAGPRSSNVLTGETAPGAAATTTADPNRIYRFSEVGTPPLFSTDCRRAPQPQACSEQAVTDYFDRNVVYPDVAKSAGRESVQFVAFTLDPLGRIDDRSVRVVSAEGEACPSCALTAVEAVRAMPDWVPALVGDQPVYVELFLPVRFNIQRI